MLKNYLLVFFISMVPIVELRGAIPIGLGLGLPALTTYFLCVLGNMLPVPFIYLFARKFLIWGYHKPLIGPICRFCINKGEKGGRALEAKAGWCAPISSSMARCSMRRRWIMRLRQSVRRTCWSSSAPRWPFTQPRASSTISKAHTPSY